MQDLQRRSVRLLKSFHIPLVVPALLTTIALAWAAQTAYAQQPQPTAPGTGSICVLAYEDTNKNGNRDPGELLLANVNVSLMVNNIVIENYISTDDQKPYCFPNLGPQQYTVSFSSPLVQATTLNTFSFPLLAGEPVQKEFGAVRVAPGSVQSADASSNGTIWTTPLRLALSAFGALVAMAFVGAFGMILYGLVWKRMRKPR